jgi:hypothetical protein
MRSATLSTTFARVQIRWAMAGVEKGLAIEIDPE